MFIDIHNHSLFGVDDGPKEKQESVKMLEEAAKQGAEGIILTPHYRHGMFDYPLEQIQQNYRELVPVAERLGISLFLGCEYHVNSEMTEDLQRGRCMTLAGSDYVLAEYSYQSEYSYIVKHTRRLLSCGYLPVIAHAERYKCLLDKPALCGELSDMGAMVQINADSVLGLDGKSAERFCKKVLKHEWADVIASDAHDIKKRMCHMERCRMFIEKKHGLDYAKMLFAENPRRIIDNR